jgi:aspartate 1-decarboxylase
MDVLNEREGPLMKTVAAAVLAAVAALAVVVGGVMFMANDDAAGNAAELAREAVAIVCEGSGSRFAASTMGTARQEAVQFPAEYAAAGYRVDGDQVIITCR